MSAVIEMLYISEILNFQHFSYKKTQNLLMLDLYLSYTASKLLVRTQQGG